MVSNDGRLAGVCPILATSFTEDGALDPDSLRRQVRFCLASGSDLILYPGVVSEFYTLTDEERKRAVEVCAEEVAGAVPFVVGVSAASTQAAVEFTHHAVDVGAAAVMAMTPYVQHFFPLTAPESLAHLRSVADASKQTAVILQNARIGHAVPIGGLPSILDVVPEIKYVKQETNPSTHALSDVVNAIGDRLLGVFAGLGGIYLVNELERGATGTMPAPPLVDVIAEAFRLHAEQGAAASQQLLDRYGSIFTRELLYNAVFIKEILYRRGVISSTKVRIASPVLDAHDHADLDRMMSSAGLSTWAD